MATTKYIRQAVNLLSKLFYDDSFDSIGSTAALLTAEANNDVDVILKSLDNVIDILTNLKNKINEAN